MAIISNEITEDSLQAHGLRRIRERHIDSKGREYLFNYETGKATNVNQVMLNRVSSIEARIKKYEIEGVMKKIELGIAYTPLLFASNVSLESVVNGKITELSEEIAELTSRKTYLEGEVK